MKTTWNTCSVAAFAHTKMLCLLSAYILLHISLTPLSAQDKVIMQGFYWNTVPGDLTDVNTGGVWWDSIATVAPLLKNAGFNVVWLPPAQKGFAGIYDMGYGIADYFDFGHLNQYGTVRTRHGNYTQLQGAISALHNNGLQAMADIVLNHRAGASGQQYEDCDHNGDGLELRYTKFTPLSGRIPMDSSHFHPTRLAGHCNLDDPYHSRTFFEDICYFNHLDNILNPSLSNNGWFFGPHNLGAAGDSLIIMGRNMLNNVGFDLVRLDAVKHIEPGFLAPFLAELKNGTQPFAVGESFDASTAALKSYQQQVEGFNTSFGTGSKNANMAIFDFALRFALKDMANTTGGGYNMANLNTAGLRFDPSNSIDAEDVVTFVENHDFDRGGFRSVPCPGGNLQIGNTCLELHYESDHAPVSSDKHMAYGYIMAAQGTPTVFWKDWFWYKLDDEIGWMMNLRRQFAKGGATPMVNLSPVYGSGSSEENYFVMRREGTTNGATDGLLLGLNDHATAQQEAYVTAPFSNKYLKDYSDGFMFATRRAYNDGRASIPTMARDYSWWAPTGMYPQSTGATPSHFQMGITPGGCPHYVALRVADAANFIVNGAPLQVGDELAIKNASGQVVGIGRIGQNFQWDGVHDMIIEVLSQAPTNDNAITESFSMRLFVYDASAGVEIEVTTVQYASNASSFSFSPDRPDTPNRNGNFSTFNLTTNAAGIYQCEGTSRITSFNTLAASGDMCGTDAANNAAYSDGWQNGDNGGTGFAAWVLSTTSGSAGHFRASSTGNGDGDGNSDGDINSSGNAFGMYANSGAVSNALRSFTKSMIPGSVFFLKMDNGYINSGASVGFGLQNAAGENLFEFYFQGGQSAYQINDGDGDNQNTSLSFSDEGFTIEFRLLTATTYEVSITPLQGGSTTETGTLKNPANGQTITRFRLFNANAGNGGSNDAYFNSFSICHPNFLEASAATSYAICAADNSSDITLNADRNNYDVKLVYFTTAQSGTTMYTGGTTLASSLTPSGAAAPYTLAFNNLTFPTTPGTYYVYAILDTADPDLTDPTCRPYVEFQVTVKANPTAVIVVTENSGTTPNDGILCSGAALTLSASGGDTYAWSNGVTASSLSLNPTSGNSYTVTVSNNGCSATATRVITVNPNPGTGIAPYETSGTANNDGSICSGASVVLSGVGNGNQYAWSTGSNSSAITVSPTETTTYTLTLTNIYGCAETATQVVTVYPSVSTSIMFTENSGTTPNDGIICSGQPITVSASGGGTYAWSNGATTSCFTVSPTSGTSYTVTVSGPGCSATATRVITVNPRPGTGIAVYETSGTANNDGIICSGASVDLGGTGNGNQYAWSTGSNSSAISVSPTETTTYTLVLTNIYSCADTATRVITVSSPATVDAGTDGTFCAESGLVQLQGQTGGTALSATWSGGNGTFDPDANTPNALYTLSPDEITAGTVTLTLTALDPSGTCPATDQVTFTVELLEPVVLTSSGPGTADCTDTVAVTIAADAFTNLSSLQYSLNWDETALEYLSHTGLQIGGAGGEPIIGTTNTATGAMEYSWVNPNLGGQTLVDGTTILTVYFKVINNDGSTSVDLSNTPIVAEAANGNVCLVPVSVQNNATIAISEESCICVVYIDAQPYSATKCEGEATSFSVSASGKGTLSYQWQDENGDNLNNNGVYSGVNTATLMISDVTGLGGKKYKVVVSNDFNTPANLSDDCTATSNEATLTVINCVCPNPWTQIGQNIDGEANVDQSGSAVAISADGRIMAIGAEYNDAAGAESGHVRVYENINGTWTQIGTDIDGEAAGDRAGKSVALSADGRILAIGAHLNDGGGTNRGHVRIYQNLSGTWTQIGTDIDGEADNDESGTSVSLSADGSILAIGAPWNDGVGVDGGHVRIYQNVSNTWIQIGVDIDGEVPQDLSGWSVSLSADGNTVAIGAPWNDANGNLSGQVRIYQNLNGTWTQVGGDIDGTTTNSTGGYVVALSADGTTVATSLYQNSANSSFSGTVQVYKNLNNVWTQVGANINGEASFDLSGFRMSLAADGNMVAIGAPWNDGNGNLSGQVRVYKNQAGTWTKIGPDIDGQSSSDQLAPCALSADGSTLVVGAPNNSSQKGRVRVYSLGCADCAITFTNQPEAQTHCAGDSTSFSVVATGTGNTLSYQWQEDGVDLSNTGVYSGVNTATLKISDVTGLDGKKYKAIVTSDYWTPGDSSDDCDSTSAEVTLTVNSISPVISINETSGVNANDGTTCSGASVVLSTSGGGTYLWSNNATTSSITVAPGITTTYTVTVTTAEGCIGTASQVVTVNAHPNASITIIEGSGANNGDGITCSEANVFLFTSESGTYAWDSGSNSNYIEVTPATTTTYTLTVTNANGCSDTVTQIITVNPYPTAQISVSETSGTNENDGVICTSSSVQLTASGGGTYLWNNGGGTNPNLVVSPATTTTYTVTVSDNGCQSTASQIITVNSNPNPSITIVEGSGTNNGDGITCSGATVFLFTGETSAYAWNTGSNVNYIEVAPTITTTYTVTVTNVNGCNGTASQVITVNPYPTPSVGVSETSGTTNHDGTTCSGANVTLSAAGGGTYLWSTGSTSSSITVAPTTTTTYTVTVTTNGCSATASQVITVNPNPTPSINVDESSGTTAGDGAICSGAEVSLTTFGGGTYLWSTGSTSSSITVAPTMTTTYTVTVTTNGCSATASQVITVNPFPTPSIGVSETSGTTNDDGTTCSGANLTLSTSGSGTYLWSDGSTTSSIAVAPTITTTYTVTVTTNGCSATTSQMITANPLPAPSISIAEDSGTTPNDGDICEGSSVTLSTSGGTYLWSTGETTSSITVAPTIHTTYTVTVTNANACVGVGSQIITLNCGVASTVSISDPCVCMNNAQVGANGTNSNTGTFQDVVRIEGPANQVWTVLSVSGYYENTVGTDPVDIGDVFPETSTGVYELEGYHLDGVGYTIEVSNGDTILSIGNKCFYPNPVFTGLPAVVAPSAAPFQVTGTVADNVAGTGTFILDGVAQAGSSPAPTVVTINPASLSPGPHTLEYSFDAGVAASKDSLDPGCVQVVRQRFQVANCACQDVTVSLNANCQFLLTGNLVSDVNCGGGTVRVMDNNPANGGLIDCAGVWTYGLFDAFGNIICWGKVTAEDKTAPALVCAPADFTLDCYDVNYVLNNHLTIGNVGATSSPRPIPTSKQTIANAEGVAGTGDNCQLGLIPPGLVADNILNLGYAYFRDNCYTCGCRITLKWSDKVEFYSCEQMQSNGGYYAKISREWVATDCNGMRSSYVQSIYFTRPAVDDFVFNGPGEGKYDRVVEYNSCTPDKSLIKKEDVTPYVCSYFNTSGNPRCFLIDQVECNYSVQIKDTEFPICGGKGVKIDRELYVFDWCAGGIVDTFHILIKIGDFQAPTVEYAHGAPYDISTGPMDCTAAIPVTVAGIKSQFGVTIKDNCTLGNVSVSVYTKDRYVKGILVYEGPANPICIKAKGAELRGDHDAYQIGACNKNEICWDKVDYAVMNGMMIGLPVGKHLMVIDAFDGCYNASTTCFIFDVKDKIAPVMKCDDDLHVTLSNANGYTSGYAQVSAEDIDEGSWDNCKLKWIAVRRNVPAGCEASFIAKGYDTNGNGKLDALGADNDYSKADGFDLNGDGDISDFGETFILKGGKLMTPLADFVEFFCCDLTERVTVELWGADTADNPATAVDETNYNYCWMDLLIEDKVAPTCIAPWDITIDCDDKNIGSIDNKVASAKVFGDVTITTGNDCAALDTTYTTVKSLKCGAGYIDRIWTLTKQTVKGPITITCKQRIVIRPIHEYNICFPKDVSTDCKTPIIDTVITDELSCDILAVNMSDKRYDASDDECYKIFRTYTVINWCTYDDRCGDPMAEGNVYVVDRATFGNYGKAPLYVLVRDVEDNQRDGIEEFYLSKDLIARNADDIRFKPPFCEANNEFYHSFMYTQIIKVYDDVRPVVTGVRDTFCTDPAACVAKVTKVIKITDNCTDQVELETQFLMIAPFQTTDAGKMILYSTPRWSIVNVGGGIYNISVANLPEGTHDLIVVGRDECGNLSLPTRIPFVVKDCKAPAPICINGLSTDLMPDGNGGGMMTVWATDFVASKIYDCNGQGPETKDGLKLITKYSVNRVGQPVDQNQTSITMTCADLELGFILVELHAWDNAGNHDFCITFVEVQDNNKVCPAPADKIGIAGTIATESSGNLQGVTVTLSGSGTMLDMTEVDGNYEFVNLTKGGDFTVTPQLDKNHTNGVSTFDLVLIQKHILGIQALNSPYKMIAADANNSKTITTLDMIQIRKLILNLDTHFANNTSWRFVDAAYRFPNPTNPWAGTFPEVVSVNDLSRNIRANFVAIKVGDVNASASVNGATASEIRTQSEFKLNTQEQHLKAGNEYKIAFTAEDLKNIQGYQFALGLDQSKVELLDIEYGVAKAENFGVFKNEGLITTSWNAKYEPGTLFTFVLRAKADTKLSSTLSLNRILHAEAYDRNNDYLGIKLGFEGQQISDSYELKQNIPNPFNAETSIGFTLPKAMKATLTVRDAKGALIYKVEGNYSKGQNQVILKKEQLGASGVHYYTLQTNDFTATKKMIILQ